MRPIKSVILLSCGIVGVVIFVILNLFFFGLAQGGQVRDDNTLSEEIYTPALPDIESIFAENHSWTATLSAQKIIKLLVTGDIIPARSVNDGVIIRNNPLWPYEKVADVIRVLNADITFINLETPLIKNCRPTIEGMIFCGSNRNIEGLQVIGTDVVSVANNHFGNHGQEGIQESLRLLKNANMMPVGIGGPVYKSVSGITFAFLAFNDIERKDNGINLAKEAVIVSQIKEARQKSDIVVVMYHWGVEYRAQPDDRQIYLAHFTIDSGADLVVSNHPHWIQPIEIYKGRIIMYAHGNFIFDQMWSQKTREGVLGVYTFYDKQLIDVQFLPLYIQDYGQAVFLSGDENKKILREMKNESMMLMFNGGI